MCLLDVQAIHQGQGMLRIGGQAIVLVGIFAPLAQAASDGVGANHKIMLAQVLGQGVKVAPCAGQAVPCDHGGGGWIAPSGVVHIEVTALNVMRAGLHGHAS